MWCWRRVDKISWTDHVRNEEVLLRVNEQRNILHEIRKRKANWIGHILRRNCLLQQIIERKIKGQIDVTRRRGRRRKKLLDDLKDRRGDCQLNEEALDLSFDRLLMMMMMMMMIVTKVQLDLPDNRRLNFHGAEIPSCSSPQLPCSFRCTTDSLLHKADL